MPEASLQLVTSIVTAMAAMVALGLTVWQGHLSNRQELFQLRLKDWSICKGLLTLYEDNRSLLIGSCKLIEEDGYALTFQDEFNWLTNNTFLESIQGAVNHPLEPESQRTLLMKLENMRNVAYEMRLIFRQSDIANFSDFIDCYADVLLNMYKYHVYRKSIDNSFSKIPLHGKQNELNTIQKSPLPKEIATLLNEMERITNQIAERNLIKRVERKIRLEGTGPINWLCFHLQNITKLAKNTQRKHIA